MDSPLKKTSAWRKYSQLLIPLVALLLIVLFNLIWDASFFHIELRQIADGSMVLSGKLISIFNGASELAILAMGMTLVTAASGGQDISVGAVAAIAGSVFVKVLTGAGVSMPTILLAFLLSGVVAMIFGAFNGMLVAIFKIQPMIATLIMFTTGRSIAYWINGGASPKVDGDQLNYFGSFFPGVPIQTPIFIVLACGIIFALVLKFTNLGLYTQAVGINQKSARLNGINTIWIKMLVYIILGLCVAVAGCISVARTSVLNHENVLKGIEMDAILAVAIGGNALGGGKFSMIGSVLGAYIIEALSTTLLSLGSDIIKAESLPFYKALVIILLMVMSSPVVKREVLRLWSAWTAKRVVSSGKGAA